MKTTAIIHHYQQDMPEEHELWFWLDSVHLEKYGRGWGFLVVHDVTPFPKVNLHSHFLCEDMWIRLIQWRVSIIGVKGPFQLELPSFMRAVIIHSCFFLNQKQAVLQKLIFNCPLNATLFKQAGSFLSVMAGSCGKRWRPSWCREDWWHVSLRCFLTIS